MPCGFRAFPLLASESARARQRDALHAKDGGDVMIRHVVLFKHKAGVTEDERNRWMETMRGLAREIPVIRSLAIGPDLTRSQRSYDVGLVVDVESLDDLRAYQLHPAHVAAAAVSRALAEHSVSVDFEL